MTVPAAATSAATSSAADFLYQIALEYRRNGQLEEAMHELQKVLLIDPNHEKATRQMEEIKSLVYSAREQAMEAAMAEHQKDLTRLVEEGAMDRATADQKYQQFAENLGVAPPPAIQKTIVPAKVVRHRRVSPARLASSVRVPDPRVNGVRWFYIFGQEGDEEYGALVETQGMFIEVPKTANAPVEIRILDADTRGRWDEMDGGWNTSTTYRVYGGAALLDSATIGANERDGTVVTFGPFTPEQGEARGEMSVFRVEVEGLEGNDNNLFAFEVSPGSAQCFSYNPSIRLAEQSGSRMRFFPFVPEGSRQVIEANYDMDEDGGSAAVIPRTSSGKAVGSRFVDSSDSEGWATTDIAVPPSTDGARWTYQLSKGTQREANVAFRFTNEQGEALPVYTTRGDSGAEPGAASSIRRPSPSVRQPVGEPLFSDPGPASATPRSGQRDPSPRTPLPSAPRPSELTTAATTACNTFKFDASESHDPDNDALAYKWDFGDGTTSDGIQVWHTYQQPGQHRVTLTVTDTSVDDACAVSTTSQAVTVNTPPQAVLEGPELSCAGTAAAFSAAKSSDASGSLTYHWDFGDGATGEGADATHEYATGGSYNVQLVVDDGQNTSCSTDVALMTIRVNTPPVAQAGDGAQMCALTAEEPLAVTLSGLGSTDPDGDMLNYRWSFGDGQSGEGERAEHVYARGGKYTATLTVDDGTGSACSMASTTVPVQVNHAPQAAIGSIGTEAQPSSINGCVKEPVRFDATSSKDPDGDVLTYRWDFGDGATGEGAAASHAYQTHGLYSTQLTVDDGSGMSCSEATALAVADVNATPVAQMSIQDEQGREVGSPVSSASTSTIREVPGAAPYHEGPMPPPGSAAPAPSADPYMWPSTTTTQPEATTAPSEPPVSAPSAPAESESSPAVQAPAYDWESSTEPAMEAPSELPTYSEPEAMPEPVVSPPDDLTYTPSSSDSADEGTDFRE